MPTFQAVYEDGVFRPIGEWTGRELVEELVEELLHRGVVPSISTSQVNRYLSEAERQPPRKKYWLNTTEKGPHLFEQQVQIVCLPKHSSWLNQIEIVFGIVTRRVPRRGNFP